MFVPFSFDPCGIFLVYIENSEQGNRNMNIYIHYFLHIIIHAYIDMDAGWNVCMRLCVCVSSPDSAEEVITNFYSLTFPFLNSKLTILSCLHVFPSNAVVFFFFKHSLKLS